MRTSRRIKQKMFYSNFQTEIPIYERDSEGNIIYREMPDGTSVPLVTGEKIQGYGSPVEFYNSITSTLTEDELMAFGGEKRAIAKMTFRKNEYPFRVGTLVWKLSGIKYDKQGNVDPKSADYRVMGLLDEGQNFHRAILEKITKGGSA